MINNWRRHVKKRVFTEHLVWIHNNLRPRVFDGSHLDFPGMNQALSLRQYQKDAVWRGMSSGNTLLAHVLIDEAYYFKNLETPTKMERVAGIQPGGSERAFDVYMKAHYLDEQHAGHGVTFATGTPISNTMVEMYTMQ